MLEWIAVIAVGVTGLIWLGWRMTRHLRGHSDRVNDYYTKALGVWVLRSDASARLAALTAAKVAAPMQRASMVAFLDVCRSVLVQQLGAADDEVRVLFMAFAQDVQAKDWNLADVAEAKRQLAAQEQEYARSLDVADSGVFERRYPELV